VVMKMRIAGIADAHGIEFVTIVSKTHQSYPFPLCPRCGTDEFSSEWTVKEKAPILCETCSREMYQLSYAKLRVEQNRQRHAMLYVCDITQTTYNQIMKLMAKQECAEALKILKKKGHLVKECVGHRDQRSWGYIPDERLDGWAQ